MKPDTVMTVAIGRNYGKNKLTNGQWKNFKYKAKTLIGSHAQVVAAAHGRGLGSDGSRKNKTENTFVIVAVNPTKINNLRNEFAGLLRQYNQSSGAFAVDRRHKPIFS